jgi:hypothetical protein
LFTFIGYGYLVNPCNEANNPPVFLAALVRVVTGNGRSLAVPEHLHSIHLNIKFISQVVSNGLNPLV